MRNNWRKTYEDKTTSLKLLKTNEKILLLVLTIRVEFQRGFKYIHKDPFEVL